MANLTDANRINLAPGLPMCRIINGMWQVSGAHGPIDPNRAISNMFDYLDSGFTTWDLADHYGPAEDFIGEFRRRLNNERGSDTFAAVQAFTKWVPRPMPISRRAVEAAVDVSLHRMDMDQLDLLQFHWWEYRDKGYLTALHLLADLQKGKKLKHLGLTNFDTERLRLITAEDIPIVSNQVQYSLVDLRPEVQMAEFSLEHGIGLLAYGTLCGGLLSERYLGRPEPSRSALNTASLLKYKQMIDAWGGWELFQELLGVLKQIADRHQVTIANVAARFTLDRPAVAGVIIGVRLGVADHRAENARVFDLALLDQDREAIEAVLKKSRDLYAIIGDCGDEYRR